MHRVEGARVPLCEEDRTEIRAQPPSSAAAGLWAGCVRCDRGTLVIGAEGELLETHTDSFSRDSMRQLTFANTG